MNPEYAFYLERKASELEDKVEELTKKIAILEQKNKYTGKCIHSNCSICNSEDYRWI